MRREQGQAGTPLGEGSKSQAAGPQRSRCGRAYLGVLGGRAGRGQLQAAVRPLDAEIEGVILGHHGGRRACPLGCHRWPQAATKLPGERGSQLHGAGPAATGDRQSQRGRIATGSCGRRGGRPARPERGGARCHRPQRTRTAGRGCSGGKEAGRGVQEDWREPGAQGRAGKRGF